MAKGSITTAADPNAQLNAGQQQLKNINQAAGSPQQVPYNTNLQTGAVQGSPITNEQQYAAVMGHGWTNSPNSTMQSPGPSQNTYGNGQPWGGGGSWNGIDPALVQIYQNAGVTTPGARGAGFTDAAYWNDVGPSQYGRLAADLAGHGPDQPGPGDIGNTSGGGGYGGGGSYGGGGMSPDIMSLISQMMQGGQNQSNYYGQTQPQSPSAQPYNAQYTGSRYNTTLANGGQSNPNMPSGYTGTPGQGYTNPSANGPGAYGSSGTYMPTAPSNPYGSQAVTNSSPYSQSRYYGSGGNMGQFSGYNQTTPSGNNWGGGIQPWGQSNTMQSPGYGGG